MKKSVRITAILTVVVAMTACQGNSDTTTTGTSTTLPTTTTSTTPPSTTTAEAPTTTSVELPGEPIDIGPQAGDELAVIGVASDDTLNVRELPGTDAAVLVELAPTATGMVASGHNRALPESIWFEVEVGGVSGWVSSAFVGFLGLTDDATAEVVAALGEAPGAETMLDLGLIVAESMASVEPPSRIVMSVAPVVGDLGEVTYDVVGLGDDALGGYRLHIFGDPTESGEGFSLSNVERTYICSRGVTDEGLCL